MAPRENDVGVVLPKFTGADVRTPQAALFDGGPFRAGEIALHLSGALLNLLAVLGCLLVLGGAVRPEPADLAVLVLAALAGWFVADVLSGVLHWAFDTWFSEDVRSVRRIVLIVREHHVYPQQIFRYRWTHEFGVMSWFGVLTAGAALLVATLVPVRLVDVGVTGAAAVAAVGVAFSLELHKLGHTTDPTPAVRLLQRCGLVLTAAHHMRHHSGEHDENYCIVNGWGDRTLGRLGLFRALERTVTGVAGPDPRTDDRAWRRVFGRFVAPRPD